MTMTLSKSLAPRMGLIAALLLLAGAMPAGASSRGINDNAKLFSAAAVAKATGVIDEVFNKHHAKEVLIETFNEVPEGQTSRQFAAAQARAAKLNGLYILIVRKGGEVGVLPDTEMAKIFTPEISADLRKLFIAGLKAKNDDATLIEAVQSIKSTMDVAEKRDSRSGTVIPPPMSGGNRGGPATPAPVRKVDNCGGGNIFGWLCLIVGVWIVFGLIRSMFNRGGGMGGGQGNGGYGGGGPGYGGYGGGYGGGGGGGWGSSLLGGLFGAAAGSYLYDRFFHSGTSYGSPTDQGSFGGGGPGVQSGPSEPDWSAPGGNFDSSGGSFGSSGGDFGGGGGGGGGDSGGGGDAGGGSFGGGDSGGGGGDFGGGGGDFGGGGDS